MVFKIFIVVFCAFNVAFAKDSARVIGGRRATDNQFPYQVGLRTVTRMMCGGSLITDRIVVTAAHCTHGLPQDGLTAYAGSLKFGGGSGIKSKSYIIHENYDPAESDYDISLIFLADKFIFSDSIKKVNLASSSDKLADNTLAVVSGFGVTDISKSSAPQLLYVNVPIQSKAVCEKYFDMTPRMLCAGIVSGQQSSCPGDSGGPLVANGKLVGIVSYGPGCGLAAPAVYVNVANLSDWIKKKANC